MRPRWLVRLEHTLSIFITLFFLLAYVLCVGLIFTKQRRYLLFIAIALLSVNDIIFVPLGDIVDPGALMIAKAWKEFFILGLLLLAMIRSAQGGLMSVSKEAMQTTVAIAVLSIFGIAMGLMRSGLGESVTEWRHYFTFILLSYLIASSGIATRVKPKHITNFILTIASGLAVIAIIENWTFSGDYTKLWYYEFVAQAKEAAQTAERLLQYQFVRGDELRSSASFVSAIEYSLFNAFALTYAVMSFWLGRTFSSKLVYAIVSGLLAWGELVAHVRMGWIACALSIFVAGHVKLFGTLSFRRLSIAPFLMLIATLILIVFNKDALDASSVGRLAQYASVPGDFRLQGYGLGAISNDGPTYKDSLYISVLMVFGVASIGYFWLLFSPLTRLLQAARVAPDNVAFTEPGTYAFFLSTIGFYVAQVYVFGLHYSVGITHLYFIQMFTLILTFRLRVSARIAPATHWRSNARMQPQ